MSIHVRLGQRVAAAVSLVAASLLLTFAGCGGEDPYQITCNVDDDCVVVHTAPSCNGCETCGRTTINRSDEQRYLDDLQDVDCNDNPTTCAGVCTEPRAACGDGKCALR